MDPCGVDEGPGPPVAPPGKKAAVGTLSTRVVTIRASAPRGPRRRTFSEGPRSLTPKKPERMKIDLEPGLRREGPRALGEGPAPGPRGEPLRRADRDDPGGEVAYRCLSPGGATGGPGPSSTPRGSTSRCGCSCGWASKRRPPRAAARSRADGGWTSAGSTASCLSRGGRPGSSSTRRSNSGRVLFGGCAGRCRRRTRCRASPAASSRPSTSMATTSRGRKASRPTSGWRSAVTPFAGCRSRSRDPRR